MFRVFNQAGTYCAVRVAVPEQHRDVFGTSDWRIFEQELKHRLDTDAHLSLKEETEPQGTRGLSGILEYNERQAAKRKSPRRRKTDSKLQSFTF